MFPYILSVGLIEATRIIKLNTKPKRLFVTFLCGCILIALVGLRHPSMGYDLGWKVNYGYLGSFQILASLDWGVSDFQNYEVGYIFFNKLVSLFTNDAQAFLFICAACSILPFIYIIYKESKDIQTSFILLFGSPVFTMMFSGLRQALAIGILTLSIRFIKEKRIIPFVILVAVACLFHNTSFLFLLAYLIYNFGKLFNKKIMLLVLFSIFILRRPLLQSVGGLVSSKNVIINSGSINFFLASFVLLLFLLLATKDNDDEINGMIKIYYLACICTMFSSVNPLAMRASFYFYVILVILVPVLYDDAKVESIKIKIQPKGGLDLLVNIIFIALGIFFVLTTDWAQAYPYYFFWE